MRYGLSLVVALAWGLWLGGLMTLFLTVSQLFKVDRPLAVNAAPQMFLVFERYQIALATVALIASATWRLTTPRAMLTALFFLLAVASIGPVISSTLISPKMHRLRQLGQSSGPEFRMLHGQSMMVYTSEAGLLLIAGFVLVAGLRGQVATEKTLATEAAPCA